MSFYKCNLQRKERPCAFRLPSTVEASESAISLSAKECRNWTRTTGWGGIKAYTASFLNRILRPYLPCCAAHIHKASEEQFAIGYDWILWWYPTHEQIRETWPWTFLEKCSPIDPGLCGNRGRVPVPFSIGLIPVHLVSYRSLNRGRFHWYSELLCKHL